VNYPQHKTRGPVRRFFSGLGSVITFSRNLIMNTFFVIFLLIIFFALGNASKPLPASFALRVAPSGVLVDQRNYLDTASLLMKDDNEEAETVVRDLVDAINAAADDKRIDTIVLELGGLRGGGITKMTEIGQALVAFKAKNKHIIAVSDNYSQDQYFLATYADEIYLHNMGEVELTGYGRYITYYKTALEKLGVNVHVFRSKI